MQGKLTMPELETMIGTGAIDTVVAAFTDMQGRLIGKRVTGRFFLEAVQKEWHACDYLLAVDMEMEPVPGFEPRPPGTKATATSSSSPTLRPCASSPGCRARPWSWATSATITGMSCRTARARS